MDIWMLVVGAALLAVVGYDAVSTTLGPLREAGIPVVDDDTFADRLSGLS